MPPLDPAKERTRNASLTAAATESSQGKDEDDILDGVLH